MKKEKQKSHHLQLKTQKGITLIALVVTIIILLILAGIGIASIVGDRGLIDKTEIAAEKTNQSVQNDITSMEDYKQGLQDLIDTMSSKSLLEMYNAGLSCANPETCTDANHLHIGDYVNYTEPTSGGYTIYAAKSGMSYDQHYTLSSTVNNLNWRVLGKDQETKGIKLIADSPMKLDENASKTDHYLYLSGAEAYEYGPEEMDNVCEMYKNSLAVKARSVNMNDIDEITGKTTNALREAVNFLTYMNNCKPLGTAYSFEGHYTPARWIEIGKADADGSKGITVSGTTNGYAYVVAKTEEEKTTLEGQGKKPVLLTNTKIYNMLFDKTKYGTEKAYWLASRGVVARSGIAGFGPGAVFSVGGLAQAVSCYYNFGSSGGSNYDSLAVRPVVCLDPAVTVDQIQKIADQPDSWE